MYSSGDKKYITYKTDNIIVKIRDVLYILPNYCENEL
jgi:hypothetical protein